MLDFEITLSLLATAALAGSGLGYLAVLAADRLSEPFRNRRTCPTAYTCRVTEAFAALIGAGIVTLLTLTFGPSNRAILAAGFGITLLTLSLIDLKHLVLPDALTLPLLWTGLLANMWRYFATLQDAVIGAALGYISLWIIYWLFKLLHGKEGLGYGDFKLNAAICAWLGWQGLPAVIFLAAIGGLCVGLFLMAARRMRSEQPLPFGPFLAAAGFVELEHPKCARAVVILDQRASDAASSWRGQSRLRWRLHSLECIASLYWTTPCILFPQD